MIDPGPARREDRPVVFFGGEPVVRGLLQIGEKGKAISLVDDGIDVSAVEAEGRVVILQGRVEGLLPGFPIGLASEIIIGMRIIAFGELPVEFARLGGEQVVQATELDVFLGLPDGVPVLAEMVVGPAEFAAGGRGEFLVLDLDGLAQDLLGLLQVVGRT